MTGPMTFTIEGQARIPIWSRFFWAVIVALLALFRVFGRTGGWFKRQLSLDVCGQARSEPDLWPLDPDWAPYDITEITPDYND